MSPPSPGLHGRIIDVDSHLMLPPEQMTGLFGPKFGGDLRRWAECLAPRHPCRHGDVWTTKGWSAPGAADSAERLASLDRMGVARQLVFPPVTCPALLAAGSDAYAGLRRYNDFALAWADGSGGRLRPVAQLPTSEVGETLAEATRVIRRGARAVEVAFSHPPAARSPADPEWDRLWALLSEAHVPVLLHVGGGGPGGAVRPPRTLLDRGWGDSPRLRPLTGTNDPALAVIGNSGLFGPFDVATLHIGAEVFLSALVLGGVLSRHPGLVVGVVEFGAQWASSWVERMDVIARSFFRYGLHPLPELPSVTVRGQVRLTPFYGEPVGDYVGRGGPAEMYAFSTDFPHSEGGTDPVGGFAASLARQGRAVIEQFFVTNGSAPVPG